MQWESRRWAVATALLAGKIDGEQQSRGVVIPFGAEEEMLASPSVEEIFFFAARVAAASKRAKA